MARAASRAASRPRKRRQLLTSPWHHESSSDDSGVLVVLPEPEAEDVEPFVPTQNANGWDLRDSIPLQRGENVTDEEIEGMLGFCCHACGCANSKKQSLEGNAYIVCDTTSLWHRRCCHDLYNDPGSGWLPPLEQAEVRAQEVVEHDPEAAVEDPKPELVQKSKKWLYNEKYTKICKPLESKLYDEDELEDPTDLLRTNVDYVNNANAFTTLEKEAIMSKKANTFNRQPATVLDVFAGIGSAAVSLKRLGVAMKKVIHVEHDKVATHVYKHMHDPVYNKDLAGDGIHHVYYDTFEYLEYNIDAILDEHGPFDIVIGALPFVDDAELEQQRQYTQQLGMLINKINQRMRAMDAPNVLFLAESRVLKNAKELPLQQGELEVAKLAFEIKWEWKLDSHNLSPIQRNGTYLSNIPLRIQPGDVVDLSPNTCLDDNCLLPGTIFEKDMITKADTLMASHSRIDDLRMCVYRECKDPKKKRKNTSYEERTLSVVERERLMGFPEGYVSNPVNVLFSVLCDEGLGKTRLKRKCNWKDCLPQQYHHFSGDYPSFKGKHGSTFRFVDTPAYPIKLKQAPPISIATSEPSFFTAEEYAKRLIGNSSNIPTLDILLRPLQHLFPSREYPVYCKTNRTWREVKPTASDRRKAIDASVSASSPVHAVGNGGTACAEIEPTQDIASHNTKSSPSDSSENGGYGSGSTLGEVGPSK